MIECGISVSSVHRVTDPLLPTCFGQGGNTLITIFNIDLLSVGPLWGSTVAAATSGNDTLKTYLVCVFA